MAVTVTPTPASILINQTVTVSGTVASATKGGVTPTGTVTLTAGSYSSSATLSNTGSYSFTVPANSLGQGANTLNVAYSGDTTYSTGSGSAVETVESTGVTFTLNTPAIAVTPATIAPGSSATAVVTLAPVAGYTGTVTLTCALTSTTAASGGDGATCVGGGAPGVTLPCTANCTVTFTIGTSAPVAATLKYPQIRKNGWAGAGTGAVLAVLMLFGIPARRRSWRQMLSVLVLMTALGGLVSCGGGSSGGGGGGGNSDPGTLAGTYTFTVQATGTPSVTPAVSTTFSVTVN